MARLGDSIDIGEELGISKDPSEKVFSERSSQSSQKSQQHSDQSGPPNVSLNWEKKPPSSTSHSFHGKEEDSAIEIAEDTPPAGEHFSLSFIACWGFALLFIAVLSGYTFSKTSAFPGVDEAVENQVLEGLRQEVSFRISEDYRTVSEIRRRYMFQERFDSLQKSPETRAFIASKQKKAKDLFRDEEGQPYLYSPEAYRYAFAASQELNIRREGLEIPRSGFGGGGAGEQTTADKNQKGKTQREVDRAMGKAIARFHRATSSMGVNQGLAWSAAYLPVAVGVAVVVLASLSAGLLSQHPSSMLTAGLITGIISSLHPVVAGQFSAGLPHPSVLPLFPVWAVICLACACAASCCRQRRVLGGAIGLAGFLVLTLALEKTQALPLSYVLAATASAWLGTRWFLQGFVWKAGLAGVALASSIAGLSALAPVRIPDLLFAARISGRGLLALDALSILLVFVLLVKKMPGHNLHALFGGMAALGGMAAAFLITANDTSNILFLLTSAMFVGTAAGMAYPRVKHTLESLGITKKAGLSAGASLLLMALISFLAISATATPTTVILPAIDDSLAGASAALSGASFPGDMFISDAQIADPVRFFSGREPAVLNSSPSLLRELFAIAMLEDSEEKAGGLLSILSCPQRTAGLLSLPNLSSITEEDFQKELAVKRSCSGQAFLVVAESTWSRISLFGQSSEKEIFMPPLSISSCAVKPEGGIACQNGFQLIGLNATKNSRFPEQFVSFVGKKQTVNYSNPGIEGALIMFRSGDRLFSSVVPKQLSNSLIVRAMARDTIPYLEKVYANDDPTQVVVYKIKGIAGK